MAGHVYECQRCMMRFTETDDCEPGPVCPACGSTAAEIVGEDIDMLNVMCSGGPG